MTKLEIVLTSKFNNYIQNLALAQRIEICDLDFDESYDKYMFYIDNKVQYKTGKTIDMNTYQNDKKAKELRNHILNNTKSW